MDHVSLPSRSTNPYPRVRCICAVQDPSLGTIQIRTPNQFLLAKQTFQDAMDGADSVPVAEAAPFLQSWLWFGLIEEIFGIAGVVVQKTDFISHDDAFGLYLDTTLLHRYIWYWIAAETKHTAEERYQHCDAISRLLDAAFQALRMYLKNFDRDHPYGGTYLEDDDNNTLLAISVLGETFDFSLSMTSQAAFSGRPWQLNRVVRTWLLQGGWCISAVAELYRKDRIRSVHSHLFLGRLDRTSLAQSHDSCSISGCLHDQIDHKTYRPRHAVQGCMCSCIVAGYPELQEINALLCRGRYPLITYSQPDSFPPRLLVHKPEAATNMTPYVAISHVWSEGLGNLQENALPTCQLGRLQANVNKLFPDRSSDIPFWIDTICVPREATTRSFAMQSMREVYAQASSILVIGSTFDLFQSTDPPEHILLAIKVSSWSTRLWTWHEGALARVIYFQLQDTSIAGDELLQRYHSVISPSCATVSLRDLFADRHGPNRSLCESLIHAMCLSGLDSGGKTLDDCPDGTREPKERRPRRSVAVRPRKTNRKALDAALNNKDKPSWSDSDSSLDFEQSEGLPQALPQPPRLGPDALVLPQKLRHLDESYSDPKIYQASTDSEYETNHAQTQMVKAGITAKNENVRMEGELHQAKHETDTSKIEAASLREENTALREENTALREENTALREENTALREASKILSLRHDFLKEENRNYRESVDNLMENVRELRLTSEELKKELKNLIEASSAPIRLDDSDEEAELGVPYFRHRFKQTRPANEQPCIPPAWTALPSFSEDDHFLTDAIREVLGHAGSFRYWLRARDPLYLEGHHFYSASIRLGMMRADYKHMLSHQIDEATSAISSRTTSWIGDEALCVAIILGLDVLTIERTARDKRIEVLARMWEIVPRSLLFLPVPHLRTPALRWMPKSFLNTAMDGRRRSTFQIAQRHERGLAISAEGAFIVFDEPFAWDDKFLVSYRNEQFLIVPSVHEKGIWWDLTQRRMALVFETPPHLSLLVRAVFVSLRKHRSDGIWPNVLFGRYVLSVAVYSGELVAMNQDLAMAEGSEKLRSYNSEPTPKEQSWCIG